MLLRAALLFFTISQFSFAADQVIPPKLPTKEPQKLEAPLVLGPALAAPLGESPITVAPGRFIPFQPKDNAPSYIPASDAYRIYRVTPGSVYNGIKFDAAADAEPEGYTWPKESGTVYILLARNKPGAYSIQALKNGPETEGPVLNGGPLSIIISGKGPQPPPKPDVDPVPNTDPQPSPAKLKKGFVVCLYDDKAMGADLAGMLGDTAWKRSLETIPGVIDFRTYDVTLPAADNGAMKKGYLDKAEAFRKDKGITDWKTPILLFISEDAKAADIRLMPPGKLKTEAAIKEVIHP